MAKNVPTIHEFDLMIYPRNVWMVKTKDIQQIKDNFTNTDGSELCFDGDGKHFDFKAQVFKVKDKKDKCLGYMVHITDNLTAGDCAHEAFHVADFCADDCGMCMQEGTGNEHIAYLTGWIADKIWQVNNGKLK